MFLLLQLMRQGYSRNNFNSHFELFYMNKTGFFSISQNLNCILVKNDKIAIINARNNF